jgi:hypothetical protein
MRRLLFAAAATLVAAVPASAQVLVDPGSIGVQREVPAVVLVKDDDPRGGYDYGPMGQCFDPRVCGHGRGAYAFAYSCPMVRERLVTANGNVIFRRHRVCS